MPLPGGPSDKIGNRYEGRWTVYCMIDVIDEKADAIHLEPPGINGIEFYLRRNGKLEYHQVKRQKTGRGRWTLKALEDQQVQVLSDFWKNLSNRDVSCVFVSTQDADELGELANRARDSASWQDFKGQFLNKELSNKFNILREKWDNCSEIDAYKALKRVHIKTVGEDFLVDTIENRLAALVEGDPKTIRVELAELANNKINHELTAHDIWHYLLQERCYRRREWDKDHHVLAVVENANKLYLSPLYDGAIAFGAAPWVITENIIPRDEAQVVLKKLTSVEAKSGVLIMGEAGVGKSGVMLQVLEALREQGLPVLAFRIDRLDITQLADNVGQQLGLPSSPAIVLAAIAQKKNCVLIIDQLDAVSSASGRNSNFFDCVHEIIKQARAYPNMRLLLACRKFDLDNDSRLKGLTGKDGIAETVTINRLSQGKVREVITELGLDTAKLNSKQLELLSIPLHLNLLAEISRDSTADIFNFQTAKDLYDCFWSRKQDLIRERFGQSVSWTSVIDALCNYMSEKQVLSAPETVIDDYDSDAKAMASENILVWDNKKISFFHEGFFDYAFARRFANRGQKLLAFLLSSEQHLFRRAQVRQILFHQREDDFDSYLENIREILTNSEIRFHIKQIVFARLAALEQPTVEEWEIIKALMGDQANPITQQVWRTLNSSVPWFQLLDSLGRIEQWLKGESEERIEQTVTLLSIMQRQIPDKVAELIEPYIGVSEVWCKRLNYLVQRADLATGDGKRFFQLFLRLISEGILDEIKRVNSNYDSDFWMQIYSLSEEHPDWACEAISCYLNHYLNLSIAAGQPNLFDSDSGALPPSQDYEYVLTESARLAPKAFIENILPFMLRVIELTAIRENNPPWSDSVWCYRPYDNSYDIKNVLLCQMEAALSNLAVNQPEEFIAIVQQQLRGLNFETIEYLLIRAYTANRQRFADEVIDYLCEQPAGLKTGDSSCNGNTLAATYWATRQLIEATTPHCSEEHLLKLEAVILDYYTDYSTIPRDLRDLQYRGYPQLVLLDAIDSSRRTQAATRRLGEWRRKFISLNCLEASGQIEPPKPIVASIVGSPIPQSSTENMTDEQWLNAIAHYDYNDADALFRANKEFVGGAGKLSNLLEKEVKKEPARFAKLIHRFPDNTNSSYFDAVLRGIAEVGLDIETALHVCQRCHQLPQKPFGSSICWLFEKLAKLPWSQQALDIVTWYALEDPNPEQELWRTKTKIGDVYYGGDVLSAGINSTRGSAVSAIANLIFADKNRTSYFQKPLEQIVKDPSIAVRSCAAEALTAMLNYDRNLAVSLFQQLCETEETLLGTQTVQFFLYYALPTHFEDLASIVERMLLSEIMKVVEVGARQACLISLAMEEGRWLAEICLTGTEAHRQAAAEIFVANLRHAYWREFCENALIQLFNDSSKEVRSQAAKCFWHFEGEQLGEYLSLVEAFI
ncbi:MAG: ATP-binding protein [Symploca sp. SIO2E9]|nr:ATP-binding protein [Symploca sp. SIO2E9]